MAIQLNCAYIDLYTFLIQPSPAYIDPAMHIFLCSPSPFTMKYRSQFAILFNQGCLCVRPSVTSDKVRVRPIRVNVLLTLDRVNLDLLCPRWLPHCCHIAATLDGRGCCGRIRPSEGCIRLSEGCIRLCKGCIWQTVGRIRLSEGSIFWRRGAYACQRGAYAGGGAHTPA
jgi:hypothetical protein